MKVLVNKSVGSSFGVGGTNANADFESIWSTAKHIPGDVSEGQARWLFNAVAGLPADAVIVEIGSFLGRATTVMASACRGTKKRIHSFDEFGCNLGDLAEYSQDIDPSRSDVFDIFRRNIESNGLEKFVIPHRGIVPELGLLWDSPIDFLLILGSRETAYLPDSFLAFFPWVKTGHVVGIEGVTKDRPGILAT